MQLRNTTSPGEAAGIVALCFGWFIYASILAVSSSPGVGTGTGSAGAYYTESNLLSLVIFELILGVIALWVLRVRGFDVASLYPKPTLSGFAIAPPLYLAAVGASWLVLMPFYGSSSASPANALTGGAIINLSVLVTLGVINGAYEEIFLLGFLLRGLRAYGLPVAIGVAFLIRVLCHLYQGPSNALSVGVFGLVLSFYYVASGKLFPVVLAHAIADIVPFIWQ